MTKGYISLYQINKKMINIYFPNYKSPYQWIMLARIFKKGNETMYEYIGGAKD